ncbi:hypothetical protein CTAYLR_008826 [Chrysophaeum taylorii]|uniref:V-type proton ATPase subunit H n=1 Tax=Chrysophaeum taylorii TaxID=2483200 RepID=A0AAD7UA51_9STRA|nr:hypothetical protein CTAYLR_008826 [Chrysophaeum taylorii]
MEETEASSLSLVCREDAVRGFASIDWGSYARSGVLTPGDVEALEAAEATPLDYTLREPVLGEKFVKTLVKVVGTVSEVGAQRYALTRLEDILMAEGCGSLESRVAHFADDGRVDPSPFMRSLSDGGDSYAAKVGAGVLATLLTARAEAPVEDFVSWLCEQLSTSRSRQSEVKAAVPALTILLRAARARAVFAEHGGVGYVTKLLKRPETTNAQMQYELTFALWTLSFDDTSAIANATVDALVDQVAAAPREKVVRVSLATLRNLCQSEIASSEGVAARMIKRGLPKTLVTLRERPWTDPDVQEDIEALHKILLSNYRELSTFEKYEAEVESGDLDWGIVHTENFWKENAKLAENQDFRVVQLLVNLLAHEDPKVIAIACYDLGEFVRFYPNGKAVIKHIGAKDTILALIDHADRDVQRHALQCVSKMLVTNWEFVDAQQQQHHNNYK